jgi:hypothetical protein
VCTTAADKRKENDMERLLDGKRIFLVEDDIVNVGVFSKSLANHGALIYQDVLGYGIVPKSQEIGLNGFISKPINAIEFPSQIARILDGENVWIVSR